MNVENKEEIKPFMSDTTIKYLIKEKEYKKWFYEIIESKTGIDLNEYEMIDNESNTGNKIKDYRMDFVYESKDKKTVIIVEANNTRGGELKGYYYLYRKQGERIKEGEEYSEKYTKIVMLNNYKDKESPNMKISNKYMMDPQNKVVRKDIESYEIYLPNFHEVEYNKIGNEIDRRLYIMGIKDIKELERIKEIDPTGENTKIVEAYERLQEENPGFISAYEYERDQIMVHNTDIRLAREEGAKQKEIEIALRMLAKGKEIKEIEELTNLSLKEIEKLKQENV